ncbi:MAG: ABC transporter substrate-binding protein [Cardiobacteriaceae bacterium]|nr:ABC transporter substrate-binding protein [Cardiobacteriaceae bacterium]
MLKKTLLTLSLLSALAQAATIKIAYDADPVSLDPMQQLSADTIQMANLVFDGLVRYDHENKILPRLAERWERVNETTTRFYLRQGVKFHSGNPFTADDVVFSFNRAMSAPNFKSVIAPFEKIEKIDDFTVDIVEKKPYPLTLNMLTNLFIMDSKFYSGNDDKGQPKDQIALKGGSFAENNPSGTGAFKIESREQGIKVVFVKNPDFYEKTGNVDRIELSAIKENATRISALLSGDVDFIFPVPPNDIARVKEDKRLNLHTMPSSRIIFFYMDENLQPAFKDKRVRLAFNYAVNNQGIVDKIMKEGATAAGQSSPPGYLGHVPELTPRYDLDKAKALMKEAGFADGFEVDLIAPNDRYVNDAKIAEAVAAQLAKINVKANLTTMPRAQYFVYRDECKAAVNMLGIAPITSDSIDYATYIVHSKDAEKGLGQYNCSYKNPELDALIEQAISELDEDKRKALLQEISRIQYEDAPLIQMHWQNLHWAYTKRFSNFPEVVNSENIPKWDLLQVKE